MKKILIHIICFYIVALHFQNSFLTDVETAVREYGRKVNMEKMLQTSDDRERDGELEYVEKSYESLVRELELAGDDSRLLCIIEKEYKQSGVEMISQRHDIENLKLESSNDMVRCSNIIINVSGNRESITGFVKRLENMSDMLCVNRIDVSNVSDSSMVSSIKLQIYSKEYRRYD